MDKSNYCCLFVCVAAALAQRWHGCCHSAVLFPMQRQATSLPMSLRFPFFIDWRSWVSFHNCLHFCYPSLAKQSDLERCFNRTDIDSVYVILRDRGRIHVVTRQIMHSREI